MWSMYTKPQGRTYIPNHFCTLASRKEAITTINIEQDTTTEGDLTKKCECSTEIILNDISNVNHTDMGKKTEIYERWDMTDTECRKDTLENDTTKHGECEILSPNDEFDDTSLYERKGTAGSQMETFQGVNS